MKTDYQLFERFKHYFLEEGYKGIDTDSKLFRELELNLKENKQFFYIGDAIMLKILFLSSGISDVIGIEPEQTDIGFFMTRIHPDDQHRYHLARSRLISRAEELYIQRSGQSLISANFQARRMNGVYINLLFQGYLFYSIYPKETIYIIMVFSDISSSSKMINHFHYYFGDDLSNFRYPDEKLLSLGNIYSKAEYEILRLIEVGLTSQQIAQQLHRSVNTINTHRYNIIAKSGKSNTSEVILDLKKQGLL
jgi:DNA-binding CsgD family transcriptional regulator